MNTTINREVMNQLKELIEDSVEYFCDDNMVSGEVSWTIIQCLATAKLAQLNDEVV